MNRIIKGKTHFYENDTLTTGIINNDRITISNCVYYETQLLERIERLQTENEKLKQDKQELIDKIKLERYLVNECKPHYIEYVDSAEESCRKTLDFIIEEVLEKLGE